MADPTYNFKEGDRVMVKFEHDIVQPGISKYQSNERQARTDVTKAVTWRIGTLDVIGWHGEFAMFHVLLDTQYQGMDRGWVELNRLQPYIPEVM